MSRRSRRLVLRRSAPESRSKAVQLCRIEQLEVRNLLSGIPGATAGGSFLSGTLCNCPICTGQGLPAAAQSSDSSSSSSSSSGLPAAAFPALSSDPSAAAKLYLDFDGDFEPQWGSWSNVTAAAFDRDSDASSFSSTELSMMENIWARVAEDYAPFNIDVTTIDPGELIDGVSAKLVIGGNGSWYSSGVGGVAYVGGFANSTPNVGFVFEDNLSSAKSIADACSHESGHLFGLEHQSAYSGTTKTQEYYSGDSTWGPIMGNSYSSTRSTWHFGTSTDSSTTLQDDIAILSDANNGFGVKADDYGSTIATASQLLQSGANVNLTGLIGSHTDQDVWQFTTAGGDVSFTLNVAPLGANLDSILEIRNASGTLIVSADSASSLNSSLSATLSSGTFYLIARSNGVYGNMGQYTLSGTLHQNAAPTIALANVVTTLPENTVTSSDVRIAEIVVTDDDVGSNTLSLSGQNATQFVIISSSLYLKSGTTLDFESKTSFAVTVEVNDSSIGGDPDDSDSLTLNVGNVNEPPNSIALSANTVAENAAAGTTVGSLSTIDPDAGDSFSYVLVSGAGDTDNGSFTLTTAGVLMAAAPFNCETQASYSIRVKSTDADGLSTEKAFTVSVTNVNEPPTDISLSNSSVDENLASGTVVGSFSTSDPDSGETFTYELVSGDGDTDNGSFSIDGNELKTTASFNYEGKNSYTIRVRSNDGGLSFEEAFIITVANIPEAPVLDKTDSPTLDSIAEDATNPAGTIVADILSGVSDEDSNALSGIAVTSLSSSGTWQYSLDDGNSWSPLGSAAESAGRVLRPTDLVRLLPKANFNGTALLYFRAWDQTDGTAAGTAVSMSGNTGGSYAYSAAWDTAALTVTPVNDAPVLNKSLSPTLTTILEDATNQSGTSVSAILIGVTDVDSGALNGVAVTSISNSGPWQYSPDAGTTWVAFGSVSESAAIVLRPADRVRLLPRRDFNGTALLYFRAWDQTDGASAGSAVNMSGNTGGSHAYSTNWDTASLTITAVNDAPVLNKDFSPALNTIAEDATDLSGTLVSNILGGISDIDSGAVKGIAVTNLSAAGTWQYSINGGATWSALSSPSEAAAIVLSSSDRVRLLPKSNFNGTALLYFRAWDQTDGHVAGDAVSMSGNVGGSRAYSTNWDIAALTVTPVNDAPVLDKSLSPTLTGVAEDDTDGAGDLVSSLLGGVSDVDSGGALQGIAVTNVTASGTWQYSVDNGASWLPLGQPSESAAIVLRPTDRVRLLPKANFSGTALLYFRAWDQSDGQAAGSVVSMSGNVGGAHAYSSNWDTAALTVSPVNDAPALGGISGTIGYAVDTPPMVIAPAATASDLDSANFDGGELRVWISDGADGANRLALSGSFTFDGSNQIFYDGTTLIGTRTSDGVGSNELQISFTSGATPSIVQSLLRSITFSTSGGSAGNRRLHFLLADGDGGVSDELSKLVAVT